MTTKEVLHRFVDSLDEQTAVRVLALVQAVESVERATPSAAEERQPLEWMAVASSDAGPDPLGDIVGLIKGADGPTDVARNHDYYLAEAYEDWKHR